MRRDVFQALADPTRRDIITLIAHQPMTPNAVAASFDVSRQAISKHIQILVECGIIAVKKQGREHICEVQPQPLNEVTDWMNNFRNIWEQRFSQLDQLLFKMQSAADPSKK